LGVCHVALVTKPCRSRPDEQSGSPPPIHTCTTRGGKTVGPSRCHNRQSHAHSIPRTGDKSPATCVKRSTQIRQSHSALHFLCLLFTFLSLSVVFRLTFFLRVTLISTFGYPHCSLYFQRAHAHTHTHTVPLADGYRTALSLRPWRLFTEENVTRVWKFTGAKKTKDGCARRFCPCLNSAPFPGSLGRYLGVGLRCRQTVTERLCGVTHRALVPPFRCFI